MGLLYVTVLRRLAHILPAAIAAGKAVYSGRRIKMRAEELLHSRKDVVVMKKSTLLAVLVFLSAVAGALGAMFLYLRRREAELEEYERLLFSEDFNYEQPEQLEEEAEEAIPADAAIPAQTAHAVKSEKSAAKKAPAKKSNS